MIELIIFDLDGVLIESKDWHYDALNNALSNIKGDYVQEMWGIGTPEDLNTFSKLKKVN